MSRLAGRILRLVCFAFAFPADRGSAEDAAPELFLPRDLARLIDPRYRALDDRRAQLQEELARLPLGPVAEIEQGVRLGWKVFGYGDALDAVQWIEVDLGRSHPIDAVVLVPLAVSTPVVGGAGFGFPLRFRVELVPEGDRPPLVVADFRGADFPNPGTLPVFLATDAVPAQRVRLHLHHPWQRDQLRAYALGEIMVLSGNRNLASGLSGVAVRASASLENAPTWSRANLIDGQSALGNPEVRRDGQRRQGWRSLTSPRSAATEWAQLDLGRVWPLDEVWLLAARVPHHSAREGYGFPVRFRVEASLEPTFAQPWIVADHTGEPFPNPAFNPVPLPAGGQPARYVRLVATELWKLSEERHLCALAEMKVYSGGVNVAREALESVSSVDPGINWGVPSLTDGLRGTMELIEWPGWLRDLSRRRELQNEDDAVSREMAALQPGLRRTLGGATASLVGLLTLGLGALAYRARRARLRAVAAVQRRIAGDLHDELGSNLANIALLVELGQRSPEGLPASDAAEIRRLARESSAAMRDIVWLTLPGPHDAPRLIERLRATTGRMLAGLQWTFSVSGLEHAPSLEVQRHLLLGLKEMLTNVQRHAHAQRVDVHLSAADRQFTLGVRDDGDGFDPAAAGAGHGLASLRHRADLLQGRLEVTSTPGKGTHVALTGRLHPFPHAFRHFSR